MILGLRPEKLTVDSVTRAWKEQVASPGVHPDLGGDQEAVVYLNTAKDTLIRWLNGQPGGQSGYGGNPGGGRDPNQPAGVPRRPLPHAGSGAVALPLPEPEENET